MIETQDEAVEIANNLVGVFRVEQAHLQASQLDVANLTGFGRRDCAMIVSRAAVENGAVLLGSGFELTDDQTKEMSQRARSTMLDYIAQCGK